MSSHAVANGKRLRYQIIAHARRRDHIVRSRGRFVLARVPPLRGMMVRYHGDERAHWRVHIDHVPFTIQRPTDMSSNSFQRALARFLLGAAAILVAAGCGRGEKGARDGTTSASPPSSATPNTVAAPGPDASPPQIEVVPGTAAPITGTVIEVRMLGDAKGYRFEPSHITARAGDAVKFVVISGGPHEIAFDLDKVPPESRNQLEFNMPNSANGKSPLLSGSREAWTVSLGALKPGLYPFVSTPRLPQGMKGEIEVR